MKNNKKILDMKKLLISFVALVVVVALMSSVAQARPGYATTGNSCSACHTSVDPGHLTVFGDDLVTLPGDPNGRGEVPIYLNNLPGDVVELIMQVDDGADRYGVQLKRFEKDEVYGGPPMVQDFTTWEADNPDWYLHDLIWPAFSGEFGQTLDPYDTPYFESVRYVGEVWDDNPQPDPHTFSLFIPEGTLPGFYDFEYAVAGQPGFWYGDQHFYFEVVPEPGTLVLLGLGLSGLGLVTWRRRRRTA